MFLHEYSQFSELWNIFLHIDKNAITGCYSKFAKTWEPSQYEGVVLPV